MNSKVPLCPVCKDPFPPLHPGSILSPPAGWRLVRTPDGGYHFESAPFPRCKGCGRVIGRCRRCGGSPTNCECPAPFLLGLDIPGCRL
jgi:hypothetical protein